MKIVSKVIVLSLFSLFLLGGTALALPFGDGGVALQGVLDNITAPYPGVSSVDVLTDEVPDAFDSYWNITGTGLSGSTIVIELASWGDQNLFGIYDAADPGKKVQLFDGSSGAGDQVVVSIKADGSVFVNVVTDTGLDFAGNLFGFYVDSSYHPAYPEWTGGVWYSDTSLNVDGQDHMGAYRGQNDTVQLPTLAPGTWTPDEYVLAFEDLHQQHWSEAMGGTKPWGPAEPDFTDFVVMVESVSPAPIPEPATMLLLGTGLVGIGLLGRKKLFKG